MSTAVIHDPASAAAAFDALFTQHYPDLASFAYHLLQSRALAEEIVQEVFLNLWERQPLWQDVGLSYLLTAVRNQAVTLMRREIVHARWEQTALQENARFGETSDAAELHEFSRAVAEAIRALPERTRLVFIMSRQLDYTYGDIASRLGISVKTVDAQMTRALRLLRASLADFLDRK